MLTTEMEGGGYVVYTKSSVDIRQKHIRQGREEVANKFFIRSHFLSLSPLYPTCENLVLGIGFILIFIVSSNQLIEIIYGNGKRTVFFINQHHNLDHIYHRGCSMKTCSSKFP